MTIEEKLKDPKTLVVKFTATWCQPCRMLATGAWPRLVESNSNVNYHDVDVDQDRSLVDLFNVKGVPTVVILKNGTETGRLVGLKTQAMYQEIIGGASVEQKNTNDAGG